MIDLHPLFAEREYFVTSFTKNAYQEAFARYRQQASSVYEWLEQHPESLSGCAQQIFQLAQEQLLVGSRGSRQRGMEDMSRLLSLYFFPACLAAESDTVRQLAMAVLTHWNSTFPRMRLRLGRYEDIMSGFRPKIFGFALQSKADDL